MNTTKKQRSLLKSLPIISMLIAGLSLSPAIVHAEKDRGHNKSGYSQDRNQSYQNKDSRKHNKRAYNDRGRSQGKHDKRNYRNKPKQHQNNWRGYNSKHRYNRHDHYGYRSYRQPVYIVNDHYYNGLDRLGFMLGIHTGNFDISFHD